MKLEREHCFLVIKPGSYAALIKDFLEQELVVHRRSYDPFRQKTVTKVVKLYAEQEGKYILPDGFLLRLSSFLARKKIDFTVDVKPNEKLTPDWDNLNRLMTPRPLQEECIRAVNTAVSNGLGGVVVAPPAFGKSYITAMLTALYKDAKIDVVSRRRDIVMSIYSAIRRITPNVGLITTGSKEEGKRITVYTAGSLNHSRFAADFVILDEVHELVTDRFYRILNNYGCPKLGMTATVDTRYDNMHKRIEGLCGPVLYKVNYEDAKNVSIVVPIAVVWYPVNEPKVTYFDAITRKRNGVWRNKSRNQIVADVAREHYNSGRQVLILTETIEHALNLKALLPEFEVCYSNSRSEGAYPSESSYTPISSKQREELRQKFLKREIMGVIATGVWAVGVSFDDLEVLIRAEGSGSKTAATQVPGRVSRIGLGIEKPFGLVIDFTDSFEPVLANKASSRFKCYERHGWLQLDKDGKVLQSARGLKQLGKRNGKIT